MSTEVDPSERENLEVFLILGHEVATTARLLQADYVSAHMRLGQDATIVFAFDRGVVTATGRGFEVVLSGLPHW